MENKTSINKSKRTKKKFGEIAPKNFYKTSLNNASLHKNQNDNLKKKPLIQDNLIIHLAYVKIIKLIHFTSFYNLITFFKFNTSFCIFSISSLSINLEYLLRFIKVSSKFLFLINIKDSLISPKV